jgi:cytoskeletal protein RodZ
MSPQQKPEWFEIADADNAASPRKVAKGLPVMALVAVAAILGIGVVAAQTQEQAPANAVESVAPSVQTTQVAATSDPAPVATTESVSTNTTNSSTSVIASKKPVATAGNSASKETIAPTTTPMTPTVKNPSIGTMPTGGGDDENEGQDHKKGGDHESDDEGDDD